MPEEPVGAHVTRPVHKVAKSFGEVVHGQVADEALRIAWEPIRERYLITKGHLEDLVGVWMHERWLTHNQLVDEDTERVPVSGTAVTHVKNNFRWDILWGAAESVGTFPWLEPFDEAKVSQLNVPIVL